MTIFFENAKISLGKYFSFKMTTPLVLGMTACHAECNAETVA